MERTSASERIGTFVGGEVDTAEEVRAIAAKSTIVVTKTKSVETEDTKGV